MKSPTENPKDIAIVYSGWKTRLRGHNIPEKYAMRQNHIYIWIIHRVHSIPVSWGSQKEISVEVTMCIAGVLVKIVDCEVLHSLTG
jgi:hypothetical protein